jgi:hypothetical protein
MGIDRFAVVAGGIRLASGVSFLVDPLRANRMWGESNDPGPSARLLLPVAPTRRTCSAGPVCTVG